MEEETEVSKYIVYGLDGDPEVPCLSVAHNTADMGPLVLSVVGEGFPYFAFTELPSAILTADEIGANFNSAPLASSDYQTNRNNVSVMYSSPPPTGETNDETNVVWVVS
jgi:hypothetical protein